MSRAQFLLRGGRVTPSAPAEVPENTVAPTIGGFGQVSRPLWVKSFGTWDDNGHAITSYIIQWRKDGVAIPGASQAYAVSANNFPDAYYPIEGDNESDIDFTLIAVNSEGQSDPVASDDVTATWVHLLTADGTPYLLDRDWSASPARFWYDGDEYDWAGFSALSEIGWTFTRAGAVLAPDADGFLVNVALNTPVYVPGRGWRVRRGSVERSTTNNRDGTNAAWTKTNVTATRVNGSDGVTNSATRFTADSDGGTVSMAISDATSRSRVGALLVKHAGAFTGAITVSMDGGTTPVDDINFVANDGDADFQNGFVRVNIPNQTLANPSIHFLFEKAGDYIDIDHPKTTDGAVQTDFVLFSAASITVGADAPMIGPVSALPFTGFSATAGMIIGEYESENASLASDQNIWAIHDGTSANSISARITASIPTRSRFSITKTALPTQALITGLTGWPNETARTVAMKWKANHCVVIDVDKTISEDLTVDVPTVTRLQDAGFTASTNGVVGYKAWEAYAAGDVPMLEMCKQAGLDTWVYDTTGGLLVGAGAVNDAVDLVDVLGTGLPAIVNSWQDGHVYWYEQTARGVFGARNTIQGSAIASAKFEGIKWMQLGGVWYVVGCDQNNTNIRMWKHDGSLTGTWTSGVISVTARGKIQDLMIFPDEPLRLYFAYEGTNSGTGGFGYMLYDGSGDPTSSANWSEVLLLSHPGCWGIDPVKGNFAGAGAVDIAISSRGGGTAGNAAAVGGVGWVPPSGVVNWITTANKDWLRVCHGHFFPGDNGMSIAASYLNAAADGVQFVLWDAANNFAQTTVNSIAGLEPFNTPGVGAVTYGCHNAGFEYNAFDAILLSANGKVAIVSRSGGGGWEIYHVFTGIASNHKSDDAINLFNVKGWGKRDFVTSDSNSGRVMALVVP